MSDMSSVRYSKLLEQWKPPLNAGKPIGCLTTTFTFSASFYEENCLSNFLDMTTEPSTDGVAYLIEREEKMSALVGATVLVDSQNCNEQHSLKWDVISARIVGGVQHSKVSLLIWQNHIRIIITSANMTEQGYCKNQETFGVLNYSVDSTFPRQAMIDTLFFLESLPKLVSTYEKSSCVVKWKKVINVARNIAKTWGDDVVDNKLSISPVFIIPGENNLFKKISNLWGNRGGLVDAKVTSPFFDTDEFKATQTVNNFTKLLNARKTKRSITWCTTAVESPDKDGWLMNIHQASYKVPKTKGVLTKYNRINEDINSDDVSNYRPLHAKLLKLENNSWFAYLCGSSNFTQRGTGLSNHPNIEANLLYIVNKDLRGAGKHLERAWPKGEKVTPVQLGFGLLKEDDSESDDKQISLHRWFLDASLNKNSSGNLELHLMFSGKSLADDWKVTYLENNRDVCTKKMWLDNGAKKIFVIPWDEITLPSILKVYWGANYAYWPVNISDPSILPSPDELNNLSIEDLMYILSGQGSLHESMRNILKKRLKNESSDCKADTDAILDPHKSVITNDYLIPRTRRISRVFVALRRRLESPVATIESLEWRLNGPIGLNAVISALEKHASSNNELSFLMAELVMEINRISYNPTEKSIDKELYNSSINKVLHTIIPKIEKASEGSSSAIKHYCHNVINKVQSFAEGIN